MRNFVRAAWGWRKNTVPNFPVEINPNWPFAKNIVGHWLLSGLPIRDTTQRNVNGSLSGVPAISVTLPGPALNFNGGPYASIPFIPPYGAANFTFSIWAIAAASGQGTYRAAFDTRQSSPTYTGFVFYATPANGWECWDANGNNLRNGTDAPVVAGQLVNLVLVNTYNGSSYTNTFYVNGVETLHDIYTDMVTANLSAFGARSPGGGAAGQLPFVGTLSNATWLNVPLSGGAVAELLYQESFAMLRPKALKGFFFATPASGALTVLPGAGTIELAGQAPSVAIGDVLSPGAATIELVGEAPTADVGVTVSPGAGTIALAGEAPTADIGVAVSPGAGTIELAGGAPTLDLGVVVAPGAGTISLAGEAPTVTTGGSSITVAPGAGTISLAGGAPTAEVGITVAPGSGTVEIAGGAATAEVGVSVEPGAGTVEIAGEIPTLDIGLTEAPGAGTIALAGEAPGVAWGTVLAPGAGTISLAGVKPIVVVGGLIIPATAPGDFVRFSAPVDLVTFAVPVDVAHFAAPIDLVGE